MDNGPLWQAAYEQYKRERGIDESQFVYMLTDTYDLTLQSLIASHHSGVTQNPRVVRIEVWPDDGDPESPSHVIDFVVSALCPVFYPDEETSTEQEIRYLETPEWVGEAWVLEYNPAQNSYAIVNRMKFVFETNPTIDGNDMVTITDSQIQFERQPL